METSTQAHRADAADSAVLPPTRASLLRPEGSSIQKTSTKVVANQPANRRCMNKAHLLFQTFAHPSRRRFTADRTLLHFHDQLRRTTTTRHRMPLPPWYALYLTRRSTKNWHSSEHKVPWNRRRVFVIVPRYALCFCCTSPGTCSSKKETESASTASNGDNNKPRTGLPDPSQQQQQQQQQQGQRHQR